MTSAFEGFAEDFLATYLAQQGQGFAQIARVVGSWNNPTLNEWSVEVRKLLSQAGQQALDAGPVPKIVSIARMRTETGLPAAGICLAF